MTEIFKDIKDYEGLYQISNLGNVKSLPKGDGNGNRERLLKFDTSCTSNVAYNRVTLCKNGKTKRFQVHRLVAEAFIPNPEDKPFVNHIDNDGLNNVYTNLEWCTHVENMKHSASQGRQDYPRRAGGLVQGLKNHKKAEEKWASFIGKDIEGLIVVDYFYDTTLARPKFKLKCRCSCGNITSNTYANILKNSKCCKECSYKNRKMKI